MTLAGLANPPLVTGFLKSTFPLPKCMSAPWLRVFCARGVYDVKDVKGNLECIRSLNLNGYSR